MGNIELMNTAPLYQKLKNHIKTKIEEGELRPGDKIHTEYQLIEEFGVSRTTVRNALSELEREGLVCREQGRGTFVRFSPVVVGSTELKSFTEEMIDRGHRPGSRVIRLESIPTPEKVRKNLTRFPGGRVICLERVRTADGEPVVLEKTYLPQHLCPDLLKEKLEDRSLLRVLEEKCRLHVKFAKDNFISIFPATENEAAVLDVKLKFPLFRVERICYLENGEEVAYAEMNYRTDKLYLLLTIVRERQKAYGTEGISELHERGVA